MLNFNSDSLNTGALHITYPELPPSSNKLYFRGTILTKVAREYAERFSYHVVRNYLPTISKMDKDAVYALHLRFYFPTLVNDSFNNDKIAPSKRAKNRYKRIDLSNRIKLLEDCIRDAIAIDDSQTFSASQEKHQDPTNPRVEILVSQVNPKYFGV